MPKTYTSYKLSDHQLQRLSAIVAGRPHKFGMPLKALEDKGLIYDNFDEAVGTNYGATGKGREALAQARREGW